MPGDWDVIEVQGSVAPATGIGIVRFNETLTALARTATQILKAGSEISGNSARETTRRWQASQRPGDATASS